MFEDLEPNFSYLETAYERLNQRISSLKSPCSLVEVRSSEYDFEWLTKFFKNMKPITFPFVFSSKRISNHLPSSYEEAAGTLFLLFATEISREISVEGEIWPNVRHSLGGTRGESSFPMHVHRVQTVDKFLFPIAGQPSISLKESLRTACDKNRLRNAFGFQDSMEYFLTVKLQFGFTRRGSLNRLDEWLVGLGTPEAVKILLGEGHNELSSESFQDLWEHLRDYRRDRISSGKLRRILEESPWVRRNWIESLMKKSRARLQRLGKGYSESDLNKESVPRSHFISRIELEWTRGGEPSIRFEWDVEQIASLAAEVETSVLDIILDGVSIDLLFLQSDGSWSSQEDSVKVFLTDPSIKRFPEFLALSTAEGVRLSGIDLLELLDLTDDLMLYDVDRRQFIDPESGMSPTKEYIILCDPELRLFGNSELETEVTDSFRIYRLSRRWDPSIQLVLGDDLWWTPTVEEHTNTKKPEIGLVILNSRTSQIPVIEIGENASYAVCGLPERSEKVNLVIEKRKYPLHWGGNAWGTLEKLPTSIECAIRPGNIRVDYNLDGVPRRQRVPIEFHFTGVGISEGSIQSKIPTWSLHDRATALYLGDDSSVIRIFCPKKDGPVYLYEGHHRLQELRFKNHLYADVRCSEIQGWGEPLYVDNPQFRMDIAPTTGKHGCISWFWDGAWNGQRIVHFRNPVKRLDHGGELIGVVDAESLEVNRINNEHIDISLDGLQWKINEEDPFIAIAYAFKGILQGVWWDADRLANSVRKYSGTDYFALLRWLHIPVLSNGFRHDFQKAVLSNPIDFLSAWVQDKGLPDFLEYPTIQEKGLEHVIKSILWNWEPTKSEVENLLVSLHPEQQNVQHKYKKLLVSLAGLCPILLIRICPYVRNPNILRKTLIYLLELDPDSTVQETTKAMERFGNSLGDVQKQQISYTFQSFIDYSTLPESICIDNPKTKLLESCQTFEECKYLAAKILKTFL